VARRRHRCRPRQPRRGSPGPSRKPRRASAQVWYLVPATEADTEKVELTEARKRYYLPNDAGLEGKAQTFERVLGVHAFASGAAQGTPSTMAGAVMTISQ